MEFRELSDEEWELIKLLLPKAKTGRPRADDRHVLNGILYVLTTGCRWMDMPPKYDTTHSIQKTQTLANTRHMDTHTQNPNNQRIHDRQAQHKESISG
jgi:transposase